MVHYTRTNEKIGRYDENGFVIFFKNINRTIAQTIRSKIIFNLYLGFNGMVDSIVNIETGNYECEITEDVDAILKKMISNKK